MKKIVMVATLLAAPALASADSLSTGLDNIGVYGQIVGTPTTISAGNSGSVSGGNTTGGVGISATGVNSQWWFTHLGFNYGAGPIVSNSSYHSGGHSLQFNARIGKGFEVANDVIVGPYLGYQYTQFSFGLDGYSASYNNNALGGGIYGAVAPTSQITLTGHVGYLAGVSANNGNPSANVLQIGAKADYRFDSEWSGFVGVGYNRYSASQQFYATNVGLHVNDIRGIFGLAYHF